MCWQTPILQPSIRIHIPNLMHVSYSLNSLKGGYIGDYIGDDYRDIKGDTQSLDYSSCGFRLCGADVFRTPLAALMRQPQMSSFDIQDLVQRPQRTLNPKP